MNAALVVVASAKPIPEFLSLLCQIVSDTSYEVASAQGCRSVLKNALEEQLPPPHKPHSLQNLSKSCAPLLGPIMLRKLRAECCHIQLHLFLYGWDLRGLPAYALDGLIFVIGAPQKGTWTFQQHLCFDEHVTCRCF